MVERDREELVDFLIVKLPIGVIVNALPIDIKLRFLHEEFRPKRCRKDFEILKQKIVNLKYDEFEVYRILAEEYDDITEYVCTECGSAVIDRLCYAECTKCNFTGVPIQKVK